ncbi:MAG: HigA family addiction module antidote protein [Bacteroidales bacterium]|nr:HigA family addiction module antidote protein [Bacteroidales bacterium]
MAMRVYTDEEVKDIIFGQIGTPKRDALEKKLEKIEKKYKGKYNCPGDYIKENIKVEGMKQKECAEKLGITPSNLSEILKGKRRITPMIAERLEEVFDYPKEVWLQMQEDYDKEKELQKKESVVLTSEWAEKMLQTMNKLSEQMGVLISLQQK